MNHLEIVNKLIGPVRPVGETNTDNERFENLKNLCKLVDELVTEIDAVGCDFRDSYEFSVKRASEYASSFLTETIGID